MPSADLDLAIEAAARARCINSGQSCIAAKRFLVADSVYDAFEAGFVARMNAMKVGDPTLEGHRGRPSRIARPESSSSTPRCRPQPARARASSLEEDAAKAKATTTSPPSSPPFPADSEVYRKSSSGPVRNALPRARRRRSHRARQTTPRSASAPRSGPPAPKNRNASPWGSNAGPYSIKRPRIQRPPNPFGGIKQLRLRAPRYSPAAGMRSLSTPRLSSSPVPRPPPHACKAAALPTAKPLDKTSRAHTPPPHRTQATAQPQSNKRQPSQSDCSSSPTETGRPAVGRARFVRTRPVRRRSWLRA